MFPIRGSGRGPGGNGGPPDRRTGIQAKITMKIVRAPNAGRDTGNEESTEKLMGQKQGEAQKDLIRLI